ncbi:Microfibrillar-associated protein 1A [Clonorchis sinensis]|uniref:Microfibrillar-associated protein 1A n=1 Tax=Clonorchis sinensis TaxID=79923 RepID=A0A8T1MC72_CLOSI|nr:Microfibrillar-associated protein 1A [Clonorchis sinensis]
MTSNPPNSQVHSTAGAVPVKNEKGQMYMLKVKVQRYVAGKKPDFASSSSSESEPETTNQKAEEIKAFSARQALGRNKTREPDRDDDEDQSGGLTAVDLEEPRLRRLLKAKQYLSESSDDEDAEDKLARHKKYRRLGDHGEDSAQESGEEPDDEEDLDEAELARRRELIRRKALAARQATEEKAEGGWAEEGNEAEADDEEELEYSEEEYTSSEDEIAPKLKPVFVRACDRITLQAKHKADQLAEEAEAESKRLAEERRKTTLKLLESELRREAEEVHAIEDALDALDSDEGQGNPHAEQEEYEKWKVRELKRIRRDREQREAALQEKNEIERIRQMTDEQRREEFARNPKKITNQAVKGQYKFLQKYYHRGAFFVHTMEDEVFKRDFAEPTLEDKFDKTKLPAVMQVKNFGRAGRTKYTHLVDQDTTAFESPWSVSNLHNIKFQAAHGGGFKQVFDKPIGGKMKKKAA